MALRRRAKELLMPMAGLALTQHLACGHVQRREQRRGTVALVVVGDPFDVSQAQGQQRLTALQGLDLTLLIDAQDHRMVRRVEPESLPDVMDRVPGLATLFGHAAHGLVSLVLRRRLQGLVDDLGHLLVRDGPGCPRTPLVIQPLHTMGQKDPPSRHGAPSREAGCVSCGMTPVAGASTRSVPAASAGVPVAWFAPGWMSWRKPNHDSNSYKLFPRHYNRLDCS